MTPAILGGILLIIGAWLTLKGNIIGAVMIYFLADLCWVYLSFSTGDVYGTVTVIIGMLLGLLAFVKMNQGKMRKNLRW